MIFGDLLRVGDMVKINFPQESLDWGCGKGTQGKIGPIVKFGEIDYGYNHNYGQKPGMYENKSWANVFIDGKEFHVSTCHVDGIDIPTDRKPEKGKWLRELPETKVWPGDKVSYTSDQKNNNWVEEHNPFTVARIDYSNMGQFCNDGITPMPIIVMDIDGGGTVSVREREVTLIERGNIWKWYHHEPIAFATIQEEASFYHSIGRTHEVRNPKKQLYAWDDAVDANGKKYPKEALEAIRDGLGHTMNVTNLPFSYRAHLSVYKFDDEEVGQRVRKATLAGFGWEA
jgi:hypothetical protein